MVNMKCEICGEVWTKDDSYVGMEIKCPNCQGRCKCLTDDEKDEENLVCSVCGLTCPTRSLKCPACGGDVVVSTKSAKENPSHLSSQDVTHSFWENFFWGIVFPWPTLILGILSLFNLGVKSKKMALGFICGMLFWIFFGICLAAWKISAN